MGDRLLYRVLLLIFGLQASITLGNEQEALMVGAAQVEITPPLGFPIAGYYHERLATGKKDPLWAKAVVWKQGETRAVFVGCDLSIRIPPPIMDGTFIGFSRRRLQRHRGIRPIPPD